ncbi:MAG: cation:proton antiporter [Bacteroidetes bacterium]|nr:cation:proton antiporter [Bacteroidota bacterium]HET6245842.1 cation:proton antiporter [Bacteroidia bacterium]
MLQLIENPFIEFAAILITSALLGALGRLLKQPLIVAFIAAGILIGSSGFNLIRSTEQILLLSEVGISILLFVVGLKLDISLIRSTGKVSTLTGLGQVVFTSIFGFIIGKVLGYENLIALYIAIALTFSSTIIIVKLLSDKKEIDSLHGQIAVGFLIIQDIVVVIMMIFLSALGTGTGENIAFDVFIVFLKGIGMLLIVGLLMKYVLPVLLKKLADSVELLVLFSVSYAILLAAAGDIMGFSKEVGAFVAGISLASTEYREIISGRLLGLRDFLLLFFFINLGAQIDLSLLNVQIIPAVVFSLFVLIGNPLIVLLIMGMMGYRKRTSFLAGLTVAQISEFSLILATMGFTLGHIDHETMGLITLVGLITIGLSTYMIIYSHQLYTKLSPLLVIFERKIAYRETGDKAYRGDPVDVIIFGLGRYGNNVAKSLSRENYKILGVDFDPKLVSSWRNKGKNAQYADVEDPEITAILPLSKAKFVISTISDVTINLSLLKYLKEADYKGKIALTVHHNKDAERLTKAGADIILFPFVDAASSIIKNLTMHK